MRIKDLATRATKLLTGNAYMVFDNGTKVEKVDYAELAKQIITEYNTQTLAGSAQSVKAALDALNSNLKGVINSFSPSTAATLTLSSTNQYGSIYILSGNLCGMYFVNTNQSGTAYIKDVKTIEGVSVSASGNTVTISSSGISGTVIFAPILL